MWGVGYKESDIKFPNRILTNLMFVRNCEFCILEKIDLKVKFLNFQQICTEILKNGTNDNFFIGGGGGALHPVFVEAGGDR